MMARAASLAASSAATIASRPITLEAEVVLLDIEGTLAPISFVRDALFGYSRARLAAFVERHHDEADVAAILAEASLLAGGEDAVAALLRWQDRDEKVGPLKALQGLIWAEGYRAGDFESPIYPDALAALRRWHGAGLPLHIYSSGSVQAQLLFFAHSVAGDLRPLFSDHFDTGLGAKVEAASYARVAERIGVAAERIVFFSDNARELEAAAAAGLEVVHVVKDETVPELGFPGISDFGEVEIVRVS